MGDKTTWRIDFAQTATAAQRQAARDIVSAWTDADWTNGRKVGLRTDLARARGRLLGAEAELQDAITAEPTNTVLHDALRAERDAAQVEVVRLRAAARP
jgi:hypothetical protein